MRARNFEMYKTGWPLKEKDTLAIAIISIGDIFQPDVSAEDGIQAV